MTAPSTVPLVELFQLEVFLLHRVHKHGEHPHGLLVRGARGVQELKRLQKRLPREKRTICKEHVLEPRGYAEQTEGAAVITPCLGGHLS